MAVCSALQCQAVIAAAFAPPGAWLWPAALVGARGGKNVFIAGQTAGRILQLDTASGRAAASTAVPELPLGLALSGNGARLFAACVRPEGKVCIVDLAEQRLITTMPTGHTASVLSPDGEMLYACNRFSHRVSVIDLVLDQEVERIAVEREPVAAAITPGGKFLLVANHLPSGRADQAYLAAEVSVIDTTSREVVKELRLPNGSGSLKDIRISPDGRYAVVTHLVAQFKRPAVSLFPDWMNGNALTVLDVSRMEVLGTVLLDDRGRGAGNPWGVAWSEDGSTLVVAHAGTHEISVIPFAPLLDKILQLPAPFDPAQTRPGNLPSVSSDQMDELNYIPFFPSPRKRIKLPDGDLGPRAVAVAGNKAYVTNYFSDTVSIIDLAEPDLKVRSVSLREDAPAEKQCQTGVKPGPHRTKRDAVLAAMDPVRRGEFYFHDATICLQGWQSCSSCHPDGRADGFNWDLTNDGIGNPKNTKSLLLAHRTAPAMSLGVRETAETAVRAGIRHILFSNQPEEVAQAIDAYLKSLEPVPSPYLVCDSGSGPPTGLSQSDFAGACGAAPGGAEVSLPLPIGPAAPAPQSMDSPFTAEHPSVLPLPIGWGEGRGEGLSVSLHSATPAPPLSSVNGSIPRLRLSDAAERGKIQFRRAGCIVCHPPGLFTDLQHHDVGTARAFDRPGDKFDTPTLIEVWRTAPYLHDGSAATIRDLLTTRNPNDRHGKTSNLSPKEIDDLCAYVLSL